MKSIVALVISVLLLTLSTPAISQPRKILSPLAYYDMVKPGEVQILDVRTAKEFESGYISNAMQADWLKREEFREKTRHLDKSRDLYVYCASGVRSAEATKFLRKQGFQSVIEMEGGLIEWKKLKLPLIEKNAGNSISNDEYDKLINSGAKVLIDVGAEWCPPCRKMEPVLESFKSSSNVIVIKLDATNNSALLNTLTIKELPTLIYYKNGTEVDRLSGFQTLNEIKRLTH